MGTQTMGSESGGNMSQSQIQNLPRQGSLYSRTLSEVQDQLGEPLLSMNLDDLLKNVLPGDDDQPPEMDMQTASSQLASTSGIRRQGSVSTSRPLSKKTVDEVWRDIQQGKVGSSNGNVQELTQERQMTLGEMTLEDFLVKAGVVAEGLERNQHAVNNAGSSGNAEPLPGTLQGYPQGIPWLSQYSQMAPLQQQHQTQQSVGPFVPSQAISQAVGVVSGNMVDAGYPEVQMVISSPIGGALSDTPGRKRLAQGEVVDKTLERRQKRMIKNRESAARSRARKQAYTNELENKVSRLEQENEMLRKQTELDKLLHSFPPPQPKFPLRRAFSAPI